MSSVLKNVYIKKSNDMISGYNNTYHSAIKMKTVDLKSSTYIDFNIEKRKMKILNLKLVIM